MKKKLLPLILSLFTFYFLDTINAQIESVYQLINNGFETWYQETSNSGSVVPTGFNSFHSAEGQFAPLVAARRCWSSTDIRPGSTGSYSVYLSSTSVMLRSNGTITTGRIYAGSMTMNSAHNYIYTDTVPTTQYTPANPPKFCQEISGTPDSLRFWVKYLPGRNQNPNITDKGRIRVYIHGTDECRDAFQYPEGMIETQLYYGKATKEFFKEDGEWHCYQIPFEYNGTNTQRNANGNYYVLATMTTNTVPDGGAGAPDEVLFDDIEFIYSAWLTNLRINDVTIEGFQKSLLIYEDTTLYGTPGNYAFPYQPEDFSWATEANNVRSVVVTNISGPAGDADEGYTSILVTAEDGIMQKEYRVYYFALIPINSDATLSNLTVSEGTLTPDFNSTQFNYTVDVEYNVTSIILTATLSDSNATIIGDGIKNLHTGENTFTITVTAKDEVTTLSYTVMVNRALSITEIQQLSNIKFYPNPTTGELHISDIGISDIEIYDIYGRIQRCLISNIGQSEIVINISHLPAGVYFLRVNEVMMKVVKK